MERYDVLLVGAGLYNAVLAAKFVEAGKKVLVIDRRDSLGGNCATVNDNGITVHRYGAHIFHTSDRETWDFANRYDTFHPFVNSPIAEVHRENTPSPVEFYNLPFNMNTFTKLWPKCVGPADVMNIIEKQTAPYRKESYSNLEEKALSMVGPEIYELFIRHYTEKQWGCKCTELGPEIISRIPLRFIFDNNYFNDTWQGIPMHGYTAWIHMMFTGATMKLGQDYISDRKFWDSQADHVFFSGMLDELFDYSNGCLPYRSLRFETTRWPTSNFQGVAVVNYTSAWPEYTRTIEHKHFEPWNRAVQDSGFTLVTKEYPAKFEKGGDAYYPVRNTESLAMWNEYMSMCPDSMTVTGRLGRFEYNDMDDTIMKALATAKEFV